MYCFNCLTEGSYIRDIYAWILDVGLKPKYAGLGNRGDLIQVVLVDQCQSSDITEKGLGLIRIHIIDAWAFDNERGSA
jgi:hypothetical protein